MPASLDASPALAELLDELREHGANHRNAPARLRTAFTDLCRQAAEPDFFLDASLDAARAALDADAHRFEVLRREEAARDSRRMHREHKQAARRRSYSAECCLYWFHYDDASPSHWQTCHRCRKPLVYTACRVAGPCS